MQDEKRLGIAHIIFSIMIAIIFFEVCVIVRISLIVFLIIIPLYWLISGIELIKRSKELGDEQLCKNK